MIREIRTEDLQELLSLYLFLHEDNIPPLDNNLERVWKEIIDEPNHHIIVVEEDDAIVSSCVCVIVPNLTRNVRPYAIVENVVTHKDHRHRGLATACLNYAKNIAEEAGCYKMMLLTSSKEQFTHDCYRHAGYNSVDKTAFIQWL